MERYTIGNWENGCNFDASLAINWIFPLKRLSFVISRGGAHPEVMISLVLLSKDDGCKKSSAVRSLSSPIHSYPSFLSADFNEFPILPVFPVTTN